MMSTDDDIICRGVKASEGTHRKLPWLAEGQRRIRPDHRGMNTRTRNLVLSAALTLSVLGAGTLAYGPLAPSSGSSSQSTTRLVSASLGSVGPTVSSTGTLSPATSLDLTFVNAGPLTPASVKPG